MANYHEQVTSNSGKVKEDKIEELEEYIESHETFFGYDITKISNPSAPHIDEGDLVLNIYSEYPLSIGDPEKGEAMYEFFLGIMEFLSSEMIIHRVGYTRTRYPFFGASYILKNGKIWESRLMGDQQLVAEKTREGNKIYGFSQKTEIEVDYVLGDMVGEAFQEFDGSKKEFAQGLRALAKKYEENPEEVEMPSYPLTLDIK